MVLGIEFLKAKGARYYDQKHKRWAYTPQQDKDIDILHLTEFIEELEQDPLVIAQVLFLSKGEYNCLINYSRCQYKGYSFHLSKMSDLTMAKSILAYQVKESGKVIVRIPNHIQEFTNAFDAEEASKLLEQEGFEHAIETTRLPLYRPLYNLSETQLEALREYISKALRKGQI